MKLSSGSSIYVQTYARILYMYVYIYIYMYVCVCIYIYVYIYCGLLVYKAMLFTSITIVYDKLSLSAIKCQLTIHIVKYDLLIRFNPVEISWHAWELQISHVLSKTLKLDWTFFFFQNKQTFRDQGVPCMVCWCALNFIADAYKNSTLY